jgi:hypothetical protein
MYCNVYTTMLQDHDTTLPLFDIVILYPSSLMGRLSIGGRQ